MESKYLYFDSHYYPFKRHMNNFNNKIFFHYSLFFISIVISHRMLCSCNIFYWSTYIFFQKPYIEILKTLYSLVISNEHKALYIFWIKLITIINCKNNKYYKQQIL